MKAHIIYAHPNMESFNNAIFQTVKQSLADLEITYSVSDLYEMNFDPVLSLEDISGRRNGEIDSVIQKEQEKITDAEWIFTIYPIWWTQMPAILKGYFDRVFAPKFAFEYNKDGLVKLLKGRKGVLLSTFGHSNEIYEKEGFLKAFERTMDEGIFEYTGIEVQKHFQFGAVPYLPDEERKGMLSEISTWIKEKLQ